MVETTQDIPYEALIEAKVKPDPMIISQLEAQLGGNTEINFDGYTIRKNGRSIEIYGDDGDSVVLTRGPFGIGAKYFSSEGREDP